MIVRVLPFVCASLLWIGCSATNSITSQPPPNNTPLKSNTQLVFYYQADMKCCQFGCAEGDPPVKVCANSQGEADALIQAVFLGHYIAHAPGGSTSANVVHRQVQSFDSSKCKTVGLREREVLAECPNSSAP